MRNIMTPGSAKFAADIQNIPQAWENQLFCNNALHRLWNETRRRWISALFMLRHLFANDLPGGQRMILDRSCNTFLHLGILGNSNIILGVHGFSFTHSSPMEGRRQKNSVHPKWDERCCIRGATQLRPTCGY
jgi:hypothetical protein